MHQSGHWPSRCAGGLEEFSSNGTFCVPSCVQSNYLLLNTGFVWIYLDGLKGN